MPTFVSLLRAVNVGGTGKLPMKELKAMCEQCGFESVQTYIASGNVVFRSADTAERARSVLETRLGDYSGRNVDVLVRTAREMADLVEADPFSDQPGNRVAVLFLDREPPPDLDRHVRGLTNETLRPAAREVFVHFPDGQGPSRLEFDLGIATIRNMNTVSRLAQMAAAT
jgi:uncharacterized protein (DUF1697 family)